MISVDVMKNPKILLPKKHIFLISHMRANTSLFGHLIGSSSEISGYYEMHIGYYSWKSLIRQKLLYHASHSSELVTDYYFDKILHNEHFIDKSILNKNNCKYVFMVRRPDETIKSICTLYGRIDPNHSFATLSGAIDYYNQRLGEIERLVNNIDDSSRCYYLDAESLICNSEYELVHLSEWLGLKNKLSKEYKTFELTGKKGFGDSSENINTGKIIKNKSKYEQIHIDMKLLEISNAKYESIRNKLLDKVGSKNILS